MAVAVAAVVPPVVGFVAKAASLRWSFGLMALLGGLVIGVVESLSGLYLGDSLGQLGIFVIFILVLLFRPTGLFGAKA